MQLYCDFDGTITEEDATDYVLSRLADPQWEWIEQEWKAGRIGSAECMRQQIALIRANQETLDATLDEIAIDPNFLSFIGFCRQNAIHVTIVSDGVDYFIRRILSRLGLQHLPIIANQFTISPEGYSLHSPNAAADCKSASGVCKCRVVALGAEPRIYIGDGRSDFCVSDKPELVFAKNSLAIFCTQQAIPYIAYDTFADVTEALNGILPLAFPTISNSLSLSTHQ